MTVRSARPSDEPSPPLPHPRQDRPTLLDILTVPVPSGLVEPPLDDHHVLDLHLGQPVHVTCRLDSRERKGIQGQGHFTVVPAGAAHRWTFAQPARALLIRLTPSLFRATADAMGLSSRGADLAAWFHVRDPQIERIGWMLQAEHHDAYPGGRLFTDSLASALAARMLGLQLQQGASGSKSGRALPKWRLRNVLDYIEAHLDEDLTLAELAAVAGFSLSHFKSLFRRAVGMPVHRFVLERRVERARTLLLEGRSSLVEIALEAGFAHPSHMARCMRRVLGVSPSQIADASRVRAGREGSTP
ncbi:helix-turn-helix domain-containing protein [Pendulispora albinea]|uniref:AraC family transcriptional regulator n=1 Tax=Pendulispora albinea TaxID=2741071 RepID=A0ABZ2M433_9BACT